MNKKEQKKAVKKAKKLLAKVKKKRLLKEKDNDWSMYKPAGCFKCRKGQVIIGNNGDGLSVVYYQRCECANIHSEKYEHFLANSNDMVMKDYRKICGKFYDNNSHITVGDNCTDRSW